MPYPTHHEFTAIARKHHVSFPEAVLTPWIGATSQVFPLGDYIIKVPFDDPAAIQAVMTDASVGPLVHGLGIPTQELLILDESRETLAVPFSIFRRVQPAVSLDRFAGHPDQVTRAWEAAGRHRAIVHRMTSDADVPVPLRTFRQSAELDPRPWAEELHAAGMLDDADAHWLLDLLNELASKVLASEPRTLCHGDVNAANVLVHPASGQFLALIDWAGVGWLDPAWDFAGVSLDIVPSLLAGHRSIDPLPDDHCAEARICWNQVQMRLFLARSGGDKTKRRLERDMEQIRRFTAAAGLVASR